MASQCRERPKSALYLRLKKRKVFKIVKGALHAFLNSSLLQNMKKGGPFGAIQKFSKKSQCRKKLKGDRLNHRFDSRGRQLFSKYLDFYNRGIFSWRIRRTILFVTFFPFFQCPAARKRFFGNFFLTPSEGFWTLLDSVKPISAYCFNCWILAIRFSQAFFSVFLIDFVKSKT